MADHGPHLTVHTGVWIRNDAWPGAAHSLTTGSTRHSLLGKAFRQARPGSSNGPWSWDWNLRDEVPHQDPRVQVSSHCWVRSVRHRAALKGPDGSLEFFRCFSGSQQLGSGPLWPSDCLELWICLNSHLPRVALGHVVLCTPRHPTQQAACWNQHLWANQLPSMPDHALLGLRHLYKTNTLLISKPLAQALDFSVTQRFVLSQYLL